MQFASDHGWQIHLPLITTAGLQLVGVRQCFCAEGGATAHAMYRLDGRPISLYILPEVNRASASASVFGHVVIARAPSGTKARLDPWGPLGDRTPLLTALKHQFDPAGILNAGRGPL